MSFGINSDVGEVGVIESGVLAGGEAESLLAALRHDLANESSLVGVAVRAAYRYDRKGCESFDDFYQPKRSYYGHDRDDVVVQVTYLIPGLVVGPARVEAVRVRSKVQTRIAEAKVRKEQARLEALEQKAKDDVEAARAALEDAQSRLAALSGGGA